MNLFDLIAQPAAIFGQRVAEAPAPREAIERTRDYLYTAIVDASGKRLRERDVRRALKLLEAL